jgi:hypothetical protein
VPYKHNLDLEMQKADAVAWAGGIRELAESLGVSYQAVNAWPDEVPEGRQEEIFILSNGALIPSDGVVQRMRKSRDIPLPV